MEVKGLKHGSALGKGLATALILQLGNREGAHLHKDSWGQSRSRALARCPVVSGDLCQ